MTSIQYNISGEIHIPALISTTMITLLISRCLGLMPVRNLSLGDWFPVFCLSLQGK